MKEQLLKVSGPESKSSFQNIKNLMRGSGAYLLHSCLIRTRVNTAKRLRTSQKVSWKYRKKTER